jgi:predicted dehydrogenase
MSVGVGVIGIGVVGRGRARTFANDLEDARLVAVCDVDPAALAWARDALGDEVACYDDAARMIPEVDAVMIATPHYDHPPLAIQAFEAGKHVLIEKPAGVYTQQVREMNKAAKRAGTVFAVHFQHRFRREMQVLREMVLGGELGRVYRIQWTITNWFRSQHYYNSGGWRATWAGEGGGVLLNQAPHQMDLWQWIFGMPRRVRGFCHEGKYHDIEVEDDVTAYMEYDDGCTGVFITSTGEHPGTDRLEVSADRGRVVLSKGTLEYTRTRRSVRETTETTTLSAWGGDVWPVDVDVSPEAGSPGSKVAAEWIDAIVRDAPLTVPGESGLNQVLLANAILQSAWDDAWVELADFDDACYHQQLQRKIAGSSYRKPQLASPNYDEGY